MAGTTLSGDESHVQSNIMAALKDVEYQNSIFVRIANREELLDEYKDMLKASRIIKERLQKQIK